MISPTIDYKSVAPSNDKRIADDGLSPNDDGENGSTVNFAGV